MTDIDPRQAPEGVTVSMTFHLLPSGQQHGPEIIIDRDTVQVRSRPLDNPDEMHACIWWDSDLVMQTKSMIVPTDDYLVVTF